MFQELFSKFSPFTQTKTSNTLYKSFELKLNPRINSLVKNEEKADIKTELSAEEKRTQRLEDEKVFSQKISDKVKEAEKGLISVYFRDPITQKLTRSALSEESINRLGKEFGQEELKRRHDGSYVLNGKAESFVSGWYADIAYTRGYLASDKDKDGFLNDNELSNVRGGFLAQEVAGKGYMVQSYAKLGGEARVFESLGFFGEDTTLHQTSKNFKELRPYDTSDDFYAGKTIGLELDKMVLKDSNLDGKLTYEESGISKFQGEGDLDIYQKLDVSMLFTIEQSNKADAISVKGILDKLNEGIKFEDLEETEQVILRMHLLDELFDEKTAYADKTYPEFNEEKFKDFYEHFVESFKKRSAEFIGLSSEEASKLDYENLSKLVEEMSANFEITNSSSYDEIVNLVAIWA
ncbi:hypothetical protein DMB92_07175 [Campylobacter sp. MIT 99-7217]|uniref:hypothetical protein n=1 Tax=Campylobacter sp. MIT 99-7217 TaxID=535091 RepID=UPI001157927C|nr:hypothetical protein [Campylobacter sp. MIT 99-7217]TQR30996.1 hypothetical protein DMB92_07175 [Campylobacter sp. MIT 99-7217]